MTKIFVTLFLLSPVLSFSQININKTKAVIRNEIQLSKKTQPGLQVTIRETDSTLSIVRINRNKNRSEEVLEFDSSGKCSWDKTTFSHETAFKKHLATLLSLNENEWLKLNESQYVSKFENRLMIELPPDEQSKVIIIVRMDWNRTLYDLMLGK